MADETRGIHEQTQRLASSQDALRSDIRLLIDSHDKLRSVLRLVHHDVVHALNGIARTVEAIHTDTVQLRHDVQQISTSTATLTFMVSDNFGQVNNDFDQIRDEIGTIQRVQHEQTQMMSRLLADPFLLTIVRVLSFCGHQQARISQDNGLNGRVAPLDRLLHGVTSPLSIIGAFLLAVRGSSRDERAAWAGVAFFLFTIHQLAHMYKTPVTIHVIFVTSFCNDDYEIPFAEAETAWVRHSILHST